MHEPAISEPTQFITGDEAIHNNVNGDNGTENTPTTNEGKHVVMEEVPEHGLDEEEPADANTILQDTEQLPADEADENHDHDDGEIANGHLEKEEENRQETNADKHEDPSESDTTESLSVPRLNTDVPSSPVHSPAPSSPSIPSTPTAMGHQPYEPSTYMSQTVSPRPPSTSTHSRLTLISQLALDIAFFELILSHKDAKKNEQWRSVVQRAINKPDDFDSVFNALKATCENAHLATLKSKAIDGFVRLFDQCADDQSLTDSAVDIIAACFEGEGTDARVELQVIRALMHCILVMQCHGATLLKAVRQIYNVFVFSLTPQNQAVAQALLTQVINEIYRRLEDDAPRYAASASRVDLEIPQGQVTLETMNQLNSLREVDVVDANDEFVAVKDAYLIFRAMCKISVKLIEGDSIDMRLHSVRSKLLSLHIIHTILKEHMDIFLSPTVVIRQGETASRLITLIKPYICQLLSKNAGLPLAPVYEMSLEMFWLVMLNMRSHFKHEIPVFWDEIYFPVAEMKTSTPHQKRYLVLVIERICNDLRCIIEFYLNYDCEKGMPNICEKIIAHLSKVANLLVDVTPGQRQAFADNRRQGISVYDINRSLTLAAMLLKPPEPEIYDLFPVEYALKMSAIACVVGFLRSIYTWAHKGISKPAKRDRLGTVGLSNLSIGNTRNNSMLGFVVDVDEPNKFELLKQRKRLFLEGVKQFNAKGKRGIKFFLSHGFISDNDPHTIARFLLSTDELDKQELGEYLGEGDDLNIAVMHAFVDEMNFDNMQFVEALRQFLQLFRLPGEAQKIDRFMLKFAERFVNGNPGVFANADTAYVLAYSVIMLNTDLHSPQIKLRMTVELFIANNAGIDDGENLDPAFLLDTYEVIRTNEIKLQLEQHAALLAGEIKTALSLGLFFGSRDVNKEAYFHAYREMANKTEKMFKNIKDDAEFHEATHVYHVRLIFDTVWMIILPVLTLPLNAYDDYDICRTCLEGIKLSIKISCMFDISTARDAFLNALIAVQKLHNYDEMRAKLVEAILVMLEVAGTDGEGFHRLWKTVLTAISQIERLQLISQGVDQQLIPDVVANRILRSLVDSVASAGFFSLVTPSQLAASKFHNQKLRADVAGLLAKTTVVAAIDRVFTNSADLSGDGIVEFVKALSEVSTEEIELSGQLNNPRTFSLQKMVDVCYYNMLRIRLEWSQLWLVMGGIFNAYGCHSNILVLYFAVDSLRQLSVRFFDIEELANFKFQREFLKPFEYILTHNRLVDVKDMVLECINVMLQAKASHIKLGWKTIFAVLTAGARESNESIVQKAFLMALMINVEYAEEVQRDSFGDLVNCFTELAKNERFQRISLLALDVLIKLVQRLLAGFVDQDPDQRKQTLVKLWLPIFSGFHTIIMSGDELEVRLRALSHLFDTIKEYGAHFDPEFWNLVMDKVLFPFFAVVNNRPWSLGIDELVDDKTLVWLLTTFIQALNLLLSLVTVYFDQLRNQFPLVLQLLVLCVCQENDTIAKIGRECFYLFLVHNCALFEDDEWEKVLVASQELFEMTTAVELFRLDPLKRVPTGPDSDVSEEAAPATPTAPGAAHKEKLLIVVKLVLQLYMIQTFSELFEHDGFYDAIPYRYLIDMAALLNKLYEFSHSFNEDYDLRVRLWNGGVIERLPNLLKQELSSLAVFINIMFRVYCDDDKCTAKEKQQLLSQVIPLCEVITGQFSGYDEQSHQRNINIWKPVVVEIFQGYVELDDDDFVKYSPAMYEKTMALFDRSIAPELRAAVKGFLERVGGNFVKKDGEGNI